jgi:group II intron reverse transcriptase/maturase
MEERDSAKRNPRRHTSSRAQIRTELQHALDRVRQVAQRDKEVKFTTLWHHVYNTDRLREAYFGLKRKSAPGVDGETWAAYGERLEDNLADLSARLQRGAYRAKPVRRVYIPKSDGRQRPIGVPTLEDKIVQRSTVEVLNAVYESDFAGFSYGFRPRRSQHDALDALTVAIQKSKVNWVLDADIRGFFDAIDHDWLMKFVECRIADRRVLRHVKKWLNAGVLEDGEWRRTEEGTPQGGSISPLLANIYLHYVFDLWVQSWRQRQAHGQVVVVRYADDFVVGFQHLKDAKQFLSDLRERLAKFCLELHPDKTRLMEFGRFAANNRRRRGEGKPATFDFLGFTHYCGQTRDGWFVVKRRTMRKRLQRKIVELKVELRRRLHQRVPEVGKWLGSVLRGHYCYYGVPFNYGSLARLHRTVIRMWYRTLRRRSQRSTITWAQVERYAASWLPLPRIQHPYPEQRLRVRLEAGAG